MGRQIEVGQHRCTLFAAGVGEAKGHGQHWQGEARQHAGRLRSQHDVHYRSAIGCLELLGSPLNHLWKGGAQAPHELSSEAVTSRSTTGGGADRNAGTCSAPGNRRPDGEMIAVGQLPGATRRGRDVVAIDQHQVGNARRKIVPGKYVPYAGAIAHVEDDGVPLRAQRKPVHQLGVQFQRDLHPFPVIASDCRGAPAVAIRT